MKCWNCGAQNQKTSKTCKKCGCDLTEPLKPEESKKEEPVNTEWKMKPWMWALIGLAGISLVIILVFLFSRNPASTSPVDNEKESTELPNESINALDNASESLATEEASESTEGGDLQELGEGCDWSTCAWMDEDQCTECGGIYETYSGESFCDCSASKWNSDELQWCAYEGGTWLQDDGRCTFQEQAAGTGEITVVSSCSDLFYEKESGSDADYQAFRETCRDAGGVDQCWDENCNLQVCICPDEDNVSSSCSWVTGQDVESSLKCFDENGTCWITIEPSDAISGTDDGTAELDVILTTSDGEIYSSMNPDRDSSNCIYDEDRISCLIAEEGTFNTTLVENIYLCKDLCCLNIEDLESGNVVVQNGDCPGSGNLEVWDFQLLEGVLTFELRNSLGWKVSALDLFLSDAKGEPWTNMNCQIDSKKDTVMNCEGWAVFKSGFATISFYYGSGSSACSVSNVKFTIPEIDRCGSGYHYCEILGKCCSSSYTCCSCGCKKLDEDQDCSDVCD